MVPPGDARGDPACQQRTNLALRVPSIGTKKTKFCLGYLFSFKQVLVDTTLTRS